MKNMKSNGGSFETVKLRSKMRSILAIIALVAVIGFSMAACDNGAGGGGTPNWTAVTDSKFGTTDIKGIAYSNNKFVAVGTFGEMATSTDGVTWTAVEYNTFGFDHNDIYTIAYGNKKFVAGGEIGKMAYLSDK